MWFDVIVILICIASVLMCGIVFVQESKGGGLASGFAESNSLLGVRKTSDFVEKATWSLAAFIVLFSIISVFTLSSSSEATANQTAVEADMATGQQATPAAPAIPQSSAPAAKPATAPAAPAAASATPAAADSTK